MRETFRESPATWSLCALWIAVYVGMTLTQGTPLIGSDVLSLSISPATSQRFGSMTSAQIYAGQLWRTVTSTFVHFSLLHLGLNLLGMIQLGRMVESWYGPWQFLGFYSAVAFVGNLFAGLVKQPIARLLPSFPRLQMEALATSAGGSEVLCGLIGLLAVVGWRSHTKFGAFMFRQMLGILFFTAILGLFLPFDNFGHAGGAIAGVAVGFIHRWLIHNVGRPSARLIGVIGVVSMLICGGAQLWYDRTTPQPTEQLTARLEQLSRTNDKALVLLNQTAAYYQELALRGPDRQPNFDYMQGTPVPATASAPSINAFPGVNRAPGLTSYTDSSPG